MDNITHAALGLAISGAAFPSTRRAGLALALVASELPDIDILCGLGDPWSMVTLHRGITHSIFLAPLAALALTAIWSRFVAGRNLRTCFLLALICLLGHIGLDVLTIYGTQILEPFSNRRFALGWVAVVDPVVTVLLLAGGISAWWWHTRRPDRAVRFATAGLALTTLYLTLGALQHHRAMHILRQQTARLGTPLAADASPQMGTIFLWRLLYRAPDAFWLASYNSLTGSIDGAKTLPITIEPSLTSLLAMPRAETFNHFAGQLTRPHMDPQDPTALILEDMRFSYPTDAPIGLWALRIAFTWNPGGAATVREMNFLQRRLRTDGPLTAPPRSSPVPAMIEPPPQR